MVDDYTTLQESVFVIKEVGVGSYREYWCKARISIEWLVVTFSLI